jgi:hypothetical protein
MLLKVKNWSSHQSYKDRKPPWIRFHKAILDDYKFHKMSIASRALLPMLWLLASEHSDPTSGVIDTPIEEIAFRLRWNEGELKSTIQEIISAGFLSEIESRNESVTEPLQDRTKTVTPETETETETEKKEIASPVNKKSSARKKSVRDDSTNPYWITGKVIKLRKDDYDAWVGEFNRLGGPGIDKILFDRDDWLAEQHDGAQKMWYRTTYQYLKRLNSDQYAT